MKTLLNPIEVWITCCDHNSNVIYNRTTNTNCLAGTRMFAEMDIPKAYHANIVITDLNNNPVEE